MDLHRSNIQRMIAKLHVNQRKNSTVRLFYFTIVMQACRVLEIAIKGGGATPAVSAFHVPSPVIDMISKQDWLLATHEILINTYIYICIGGNIDVIYYIII